MFYQGTEIKGKDKRLNKVFFRSKSGNVLLFDLLNDTSEKLEAGTPTPKSYRKMAKGEFEKLLFETM